MNDRNDSRHFIFKKQQKQKSSETKDKIHVQSTVYLSILEMRAVRTL